MQTPKLNTPKLNTKALQINKQQSSMMIIVAVATVITVFSLISAKTLLGQAAYQRRVINARHSSAQQLNDDIKNANTLVTQYNNVFIGTSDQNIIGHINHSTEVVNGQTIVTAPPDGDNGRIVTDALPTLYNFPALLTSVSKILSDDSIGSPSIGGTDQSTTADNSPSDKPAPIKIDLTISGSGTYSGSEKLIKDLERSIRPFDVTHLTLTGNESNLTVDLNVSTYYQPAKTVNITSKEIH
ncbi:MAG TPA: hypothetical protein VMT23_00025 [Candidatus Binatia bacterium]|nr:hypothetical protein [Candidatus Binatia bacterium]